MYCVLTSDDNTNLNGLSWFLNLIDSHEIKSTLFCNKAISPEVEKLFISAHENGHEIANHTLTHSNDNLEQEISRCQSYFKSIGITDVIGFRLPFLDVGNNPNLIQILHKLGFTYDSSYYDRRHAVPYNMKGITEIPLSTYTDGQGTISGFDYNIYEVYKTGNDLGRILIDTYNDKSKKNLPLIVNLHSHYYGEWDDEDFINHKEAQKGLKMFIDYAVKNKAEFITARELLDIYDNTHVRRPFEHINKTNKYLANSRPLLTRT